MARGQHPPAGENIHSAVSATVGPAYPAATIHRSRLPEPLPGTDRGGTAPPRGRRAWRVPRLPGDMGVPLPAVGKEHATAIAVSAEQGGTDRSVRSGGDILERYVHTATVVLQGWN